MKLKKRVWLIFALLAAAYLLTNVVWKRYGKDERIVYRHSADPVTTLCRTYV